MDARFLRLRGAALLLVVPALAFFPGCLNSDDSPEDETLDEAEGEMAAALGELAIELESSIAEHAPELLIEGYGSSLREESVSWSEENGEWVLTITQDYEDDEASGRIEATERVRFLNDGVVVQHPDASTDEMRVALAGTNAGNYHPSEQWNVDFALSVDRAIVVTRDGNGAIDLDGTSTVGGSSIYHVGERNFPRQASLAWTSDLHWIPESTCASGSVDGTNGRHDLHATFDGSGGVTWEVLRGSRVVRNGNESYECSLPPAE